jgi:hypothetical protein
MLLNILGETLAAIHGQLLTQSLLSVIHGYVQSAATLAFNTFPLKNRLSDIANLHYIDGPPMYRNAPPSSSRPWWILDNDLEHNVKASGRWNDCVHFHPISALGHRTIVLIK